MNRIATSSAAAAFDSCQARRLGLLPPFSLIRHLYPSPAPPLPPLTGLLTVHRGATKVRGHPATRLHRGQTETVVGQGVLLSGGGVAFVPFGLVSSPG